MQRRTLWLVGLLFGIALVAVLARPPKVAGRPHVTGATAAPSAATPAVESQAPPQVSPSASPSGDDDAPRTDRFHVLPDGSPVPALPKDAPRSVRFGVILFAYAGAEGAEGVTRSRKDAFAAASSVVAQARDNFADAVKLGDRGSLSDAGTIGRGFLEPTVEYTLFSLAKGEVTDPPLDTPKGFWVARRLN
jgi:hypothetical protein